jgi:hypothetical protein
MAQTQVKSFNDIGRILSCGEWRSNANLKHYELKESSLKRTLHKELTSKRRRYSRLCLDFFRAKVKSLAFFPAVSVFNSINNPVEVKEISQYCIIFMYSSISRSL